MKFARRRGLRTIPPYFLVIILTLSLFGGTRAPVYASSLAADSPVPFGADAPSAWAREETLKAKEYGLVPDGMYHSFTQNMTRADFCALVMSLYAKLTAEPMKLNLTSVFSDTGDVAVLNAYELGIVRGVGGGRFAPETAITRQEIAVMLYNSIKAINGFTGKDILKNKSATLTFADGSDTADWAAEAISALRNNEIMIGDDKNRFNPLENTTKEMAFILVKRIYLIYSGVDAKRVFPAAHTGEILMSIKSVFTSGAELQIFGDVFEMYPEISTAELDGYLSGSAFSDAGGNLYYADKSESLNESFTVGYMGGMTGGGGYYPVYVFIGENSPGVRLYLVYGGAGYRFYMDSGQKEPFLQKTFSDVIFPVKSDAAVAKMGAGAGPDAGALTFSELYRNTPELLDVYLWYVRLDIGTAVHFMATVG